VREEGVDTGRDVWLKVVRSLRSTEGLMRVSWIGRPQLLLEQQKNLWPWNPWTTAFGGLGGLSVWSAGKETPFSHSFEMEQRSAADASHARVPSTSTRHDRQKVGAVVIR
jgi:hypothetical protein